MFDEILCAFSVRIRDLGWVACALFGAGFATITLIHACASAPATHREADLNAAVRRVQAHEAAIATAACARDACEHARQICDEAHRLVDADLEARCHQANHACDDRNDLAQGRACD